MSFRSHAEQLRRAREILNMREDVEEAEVLAFIARMNAETAASIASSRPSIQPALQRELQADYDEERRDGWALERAPESL